MAEGRTLKFLHDTHDANSLPSTGYYVWAIREHLVCHDGFTMSVQASPGHYCNLRAMGVLNRITGTSALRAADVPYSNCEVYCLNQPESLFDEFGDDSNPYGYVPLEVVDMVIAKHGGLACDPPPPLPTIKLPTGLRALDLT